MNEDQVIDLIKRYTSSTFQKRIGDTPTDALQLTPKRYVDKQIASAIAGGGSGGGSVAGISFGIVNANGTPALMPSGWTSSTIGVGSYQITHTLGTASIAFAGTVYVDQGVGVGALVVTPSIIQYRTSDPSVGLVNEKISFIVAK